MLASQPASLMDGRTIGQAGEQANIDIAGLEHLPLHFPGGQNHYMLFCIDQIGAVWLTGEI